jgi:hypothetical protein
MKRLNAENRVCKVEKEGQKSKYNIRTHSLGKGKRGK